MYQYRITVNASENITDEYPGDQWEKICRQAESRGGINATLSRRYYGDAKVLKLISSDKWIDLGDGDCIGPWECMAEVDGRN